MRKFVSRFTALAVATPLLAAAIAVAGTAAPASAACSTANTYAGVEYYLNTGCSSLYFDINGDTMRNFGVGMSSLNIGVAFAGPDSWRVYLHTSTDSAGSYIGFSNTSTSVRKSYDLTNYALGGGTWNDQPKSLCQIRVTGTYSVC